MTTPNFEFTLDDIKKISEIKDIRGKKFSYFNGIAPLDNANSGNLSFLSSSKYKKKLFTTKASVIIVPFGIAQNPPENQTWIYTENPSLLVSKICLLIQEKTYQPPDKGIHSSSFVKDSALVSDQAYVGPFCHISEGAKISDGVVLESHCYIGKNVIIGKNTVIKSQVSIEENCRIGNNCVLHPGVVVGSDGFGYEFVSNRHNKISHIGGVFIDNFVEIGSNTVIDRGRFENTHIGEGTKIDNLVHIAHNVKVGCHCLLLAQCGIAGSTELDDFVVIAGQAGIVGHIKLGKASKVGAQAGVIHDLPENSYVTGSPAMPFIAMQKVYALQRKLPEIKKRIQILEKESDRNYFK